jgi:hypothetical protein
MDLGALVEQEADDVHPPRTRSRFERRPARQSSVQQPPVLMHEAPHLAQVAFLGRLDT